MRALVGSKPPKLMALALALAWCTSGRGTSVVLLNEASLVARADVILQGTVLSSESAYRNGPVPVFTDVTVEVHEVLKGTSSDSVVHVGMPGGELDGQRYSIAGVPSFQPGEQVALFLVALPSGGYMTVGMGQGKYHLATDPQTGLVLAFQAFQGTTPVPLVQPGQTQRQALSAGAPLVTDWDVFRRRIRQQVQGTVDR